MFSIVLDYPIKLQKGLRYSRVEVEQQTHYGDKIGLSYDKCILEPQRIMVSKWSLNKAINTISLPNAKILYIFNHKRLERGK